jgi:hypothetical protein
MSLCRPVRFVASAALAAGILGCAQTPKPQSWDDVTEADPAGAAAPAHGGTYFSDDQCFAKATDLLAVNATQAKQLMTECIQRPDFMMVGQINQEPWRKRLKLEGEPLQAYMRAILRSGNIDFAADLQAVGVDAVNYNADDEAQPRAGQLIVFRCDVESTTRVDGTRGVLARPAVYFDAAKARSKIELLVDRKKVAPGRVEGTLVTGEAKIGNRRAQDYSDSLVFVETGGAVPFKEKEGYLVVATFKAVSEVPEGIENEEYTAPFFSRVRVVTAVPTRAY